LRLKFLERQNFWATKYFSGKSDHTPRNPHVGSPLLFISFPEKRSRKFLLSNFFYARIFPALNFFWTENFYDRKFFRTEIFPYEIFLNRKIPGREGFTGRRWRKVTADGVGEMVHYGGAGFQKNERTAGLHALF
jgi:hypothetical protein